MQIKNPILQPMVLNNLNNWGLKKELTSTYDKGGFHKIEIP